MKVLSFGHIPTWAGGRQETGLANVIYQLAKHGSEVEGARVGLAATDSFVPFRQDGRLTIYGWTKKMLVLYFLSHPSRTIKNLFKLIVLKRHYPLKESIISLFLKRIFFDKTIRGFCPNIVQLHGVGAIWYMDLVPKTSKIAVTFHGMTGIDNNIPQNNVLYKMEQDVFHSNRVDAFFYISTQLVDSFKKEYGDNHKENIVIFNSYDNTHFYIESNHKTTNQNVDKEANHKVTLCTVASLSDLKGQMRVLSGISLLKNKNRFRYICIGGDSIGLSTQLEKFAQDHELDYKYLGKMRPDDIRHHLQEVDYMIMPSTSEGFGLSYLEAIACGVPVILPKNLPIAQEKDLINDNNSILLEDCSAESIANTLNHIDDFYFESRSVATTLSCLSWDQIAKQYYSAFAVL